MENFEDLTTVRFIEGLIQISLTVLSIRLSRVDSRASSSPSSSIEAENSVSKARQSLFCTSSCTNTIHRARSNVVVKLTSGASIYIELFPRRDSFSINFALRRGFPRRDTMISLFNLVCQAVSPGVVSEPVHVPVPTLRGIKACGVNPPRRIPMTLQ